MKLLQNISQIETTNIQYYDLYYTVIRIKHENKDTDEQYEDDNNDYIDFNDIITPNHHIGIKNREI